MAEEEREGKDLASGVDGECGERLFRNADLAQLKLFVNVT